MNHVDAEHAVADVLARLDRNQHVEDSTIELKSRWIEPAKAARRIAGHANSSGDGTAVWMIGIDERQGLVGTEVAELHNWWPQVARCFDGPLPTMQDFTISVDGLSVVVLVFSVPHRPYVVRLPGAATSEVPWREATRVRSARRSELLQLTTPLASLPRSTIVKGHFEARAIRPAEGDEFCQCNLQLDIVLDPVDRHPVIVFRLLVSAQARASNLDILISDSLRVDVELAVKLASKPILLTAQFALPREGSSAWRNNWDKRKKWEFQNES